MATSTMQMEEPTYDPSSSVAVTKDARSVSGKSAVTAKTQESNYNSDFDDSDEEVESLTSNEENKINDLASSSSKGGGGGTEEVNNAGAAAAPKRGLQHRDSMLFNKSNVSHTASANQPKAKVLSAKENQIIFNSNKGKMVVFYKKHNKSKLRSIEDTLNKYAGKEDDLYELILGKYGKKKTSKFSLQKSYPGVVEDESDEDDIDGGGMSAQMQARMEAMKNKTGMRACDSMKLIPTGSHGMRAMDSMKHIQTSANDDSDDDDDDGGGGMTPQMEARMIAQREQAAKSKMGMTAMDSMKFIPTFKDDDDDDDDNWSVEDESAVLTSTLADEHARNLSDPLPLTGRTISFGVIPDVFSTTQLKGTNPPPHPLPLKRNLSYSEEVRINHIKSFKHELTTKEIEEVWYQDWEMVMMKFDCGLYGKEAENRQKQNQEKVNAQRRNSSSGGKAKSDAKAKAMKKKYGIDKKVKDNSKKDTDDGTKKKKKKGLFGFGKKKK